MIKRLPLIALSLFILTANTVCVHAQHKLLFALDLVRHGDRTPYEYIPKISNAWDKNKTGILTNIGKEQATLLGTNFKEHYISKMNLLPHEFNSDLIYVQSTDFQRTQETARSILKGLYPNFFNNITIIVPDFQKDIVNPRNKKNVSTIAKKLLTDTVIAHKLCIPAVKKQLGIINNIFGTKFSKTSKFKNIADLIKVSEIHKKPLLKPLPKKIKESIISIGDKSKIRFLSHTDIACEYSKDFTMHIANLLEKHNAYKQKYFLYTLHDTNIMTILSLLDFNLEKRLPYLANLKFELLQNTDNYKIVVRTSLNSKEINLCSSTSKYCSLKDFVQTLKKNIGNKCRST